MIITFLRTVLYCYRGNMGGESTFLRNVSFSGLAILAFAYVHAAVSREIITRHAHTIPLQMMIVFFSE